jgi:hypothetical protein
MSSAAEIIAILQDPASATYQTETREIQTTVGAMEKKIITFKPASAQEINAAEKGVLGSSAWEKMRWRSYQRDRLPKKIKSNSPGGS